VVRLVHRIGTELRDTTIFDGTGNVEEFMDYMITMIPEEQLVLALDATPRPIPSRWLATHKDNFQVWEEVQPTLRHWFNPPAKY